MPALFTPRPESQLVIDLPGERLLATVRKIVDRNSVICELTTQPLGKSHTYKFRELVPVRRIKDMLGDKWEAVSQAEMRVAAKAASAKKGGKDATRKRK